MSDRSTDSSAEESPSAIDAAEEDQATERDMFAATDTVVDSAPRTFETDAPEEQPTGPDIPPQLHSDVDPLSMLVTEASVFSELDEPLRRSRKRRFDTMMFVGLIATLVLHGGALFGVLYVRNAGAHEDVPPARKYVVAELVRKGKKRDPKKLPDRVVPVKATVEREVVDRSASADDRPVTKKRKDRPRHADLADKMRRAFRHAEFEDASARQSDVEGDPHGVAHGTATQKRAGDLYMTRIADLWNRTWSLPSIIPSQDAKRLYVLIVVRIDATGTISFPIQFDRRSGNSHFDNSVRAAWQRIQRLPLPPPDRLAQILSRGLALKLTWRGMR